MTTTARLPARIREDHAKHAGAEAARILTSAEHAILASMGAATAKVTTGSLTPQMGRRKVRIATSAELGAASARLQAVYGRAAEQATGEAGPLPDAPGQVAAAILRAQQDADVAFGAVLAAAGAQGSRLPPPSSPYRKIVSKAQQGKDSAGRAGFAIAAVTARGLTGYTSPKGRRWPLAAYAERAVRTATSQLAKAPVMSEITARRQQLAAEHVTAVTAAWNQAVTGLDARDAVRAFRADSRSSASGQPSGVLKRWRQEAARAASVEFLSRIYQSGRYTALLAALGQAVRDGMAEGEADALAMAAYRQGLAGFDISAAFAAAGARLEGDIIVTSASRDAADRMIRGAAADFGRALPVAAEDAGEGEIAGYLDTFLRGEDIGAVSRWTDEALWSAFGEGAVRLYRRVASGQFTGLGIDVDWNTDSSPCSMCEENRDGSPYAPWEVPAYPGHRGCRCWLTSDTRLPLALLTQFLAAA